MLSNKDLKEILKKSAILDFSGHFYHFGPGIFLGDIKNLLMGTLRNNIQQAEFYFRGGAWEPILATTLKGTNIFFTLNIPTVVRYHYTSSADQHPPIWGQQTPAQNWVSFKHLLKDVTNLRETYSINIERNYICVL